MSLATRTQKEVAGRIDYHLAILSSKTYVFEDKLTRCWLV